MKLINAGGKVASEGANGRPRFEIDRRPYVGLRFRHRIEYIITFSTCEHSQPKRDQLIWLRPHTSDIFCDLPIEDVGA